MIENKKVFLIAISGAINSKKLKNAKETLSKWNFKSKELPGIMSSYLGYAGTPERRASELNAAYEDKDSDFIFSVRGGMGAISILDKLDYNKIKKSNKSLMGYSDITILLNYINKKTGSYCLHGPNLAKPLKNFHKKTISCLFDVLNRKDYRVSFEEKDIFKKGFAKAPIVGGNVRLLSRSLGTPYEIETKNKIVFIEAADKDGQWLFDMLWQLKQAGKFDKVKGIILGHFTRCEKGIENYLKEFFKDFKCPVIMNQPFGHEEPNLTIPIGETCVIDTEKKYWGIRF